MLPVDRHNAAIAPMGRILRHQLVERHPLLRAHGVQTTTPPRRSSVFLSNGGEAVEDGRAPVVRRRTGGGAHLARVHVEDVDEDEGHNAGEGHPCAVS